MHFYFDYNSDNVPEDILQLASIDNLIYVDVLSMGAKAMTGLSNAEAEDVGRIKNHWLWRFPVITSDGSHGSVQFGFNLSDTPSIPSDRAQYTGSSRRLSGSNGSGSGSVSSQNLGSDKGAVFDEVDSTSKPPDAPSTSGEYATDDAPSVVGAPSLRTSLGCFIQQPSSGHRHPGTFDIIARPRSEPSWKARFTRSFRLAAGTTFGKLFRSVRSRGMEPFHFRQVGLVIYGCRDGISQFAAAWLKDELLEDGFCEENPPMHIYDLLSWRYSRPTIVGAVTTSDEEEGVIPPIVRAKARSVSYIDRAIWPDGYTHVEDSRLYFKP